MLCQALISSLALTSLTAAAAANPTDPVKAITSATSWDEVIKQVDARFPKLITDELRAATKDVAFPMIRSYRGQLVVTDSSGARMTLAFGKDGTATVNGKQLSIRPLATVGAEVKRISSGELKGAALIDYLIPDARAAGLIGAGMASLAFSGANAWKADACAEEELSDELTQSCPLMGVGMVHLASAGDAIDKSNKPYKTIGLKCPKDNGGVLEHIRKNEDGISTRMRFKFRGDKVANITYEAAERGKSFETLDTFDMENPKSDKSLKVGNRAIELVNPFIEKICNGPKESKERFFAITESNRKQLAVYDSDSPQVHKSSMEVE